MTSPTYFELHGKQYLAVRQMLDRGWSLELIASKLGEPDCIHVTSLGARKLYLRHRVIAAEQDSLEVTRALAIYWGTIASEAKRLAKRHVARFEYLEFWSRHQELMREVEQDD